MSWHGAEKRKQKEKGAHLTFWMCNVPFGKHIWILGPQLVALFKKVLEPCGDEASLGKVDHWGHALRFYSLTPLPVHSASCPLSDSCPQKTEVTGKQPQSPTLIAREMPATILSLLRPYIFHTQTLPSRSFLLGIGYYWLFSLVTGRKGSKFNSGPTPGGNASRSESLPKSLTPHWDRKGSMRETNPVTLLP